MNLTLDYRLHPRVEQQNLDVDFVKMLCDQVQPRLVPFGKHVVESGVAILDWDHRLPSRALTLRLHLFYGRATYDWFEQAYARRRKEIDERNRFPEFDVPDFTGLPADEAYDVELGPNQELQAIKLVSAWRREVAPEDATRATTVVRASASFQRLQIGLPERPAQLGDLEAVAWVAPCESGHLAWAIDVWWLTSFDGRVGKGWSFVVDPDGLVLTAREFSVRAQ